MGRLLATLFHKRAASNAERGRVPAMCADSWARAKSPAYNRVPHPLNTMAGGSADRANQILDDTSSSQQT